MKKVKMLSVVIILMLMGCQKVDIQPAPQNDNPVKEKVLSPLTAYSTDANRITADAPINARQVTRTIKIQGSGTISIIPNGPNCNGDFLVIVQGSGHASHLGLFTVELTYCSDGIDPTSPVTGVQTAANGDQLFTVLVFAGVDPVLGPYQDYIYYGGTGRFTNATGEIRLYVTIDNVNMVWSNYGEGTLTY